jgi:hypothetical protein
MYRSIVAGQKLGQQVPPKLSLEYKKILPEKFQNRIYWNLDALFEIFFGVDLQ